MARLFPVGRDERIGGYYLIHAVAAILHNATDWFSDHNGARRHIVRRYPNHPVVVAAQAEAAVLAADGAGADGAGSHGAGTADGADASAGDTGAGVSLSDAGDANATTSELGGGGANGV